MKKTFDKKEEHVRNKCNDRNNDTEQLNIPSPYTVTINAWYTVQQAL